MRQAAAAWRTVGLVTIVTVFLSDWTRLDAFTSTHPVVVMIMVGIAAAGSSLLAGSVLPGLLGAAVGVGIDLMCQSAGGSFSTSHLAARLPTGALLTVLFCLDRGRRRRGETGWFSSPWLTLASVVMPLAVTKIGSVVMAQPWTADDLRQALALSLLITVARLIAALVIGLPNQIHGSHRLYPPVDGWTVLNTVAGHAVFALSCVVFLLLVPVLVIIPARQRRVTTLMRFGARLVILVAPGVRWRATGELDALQASRVVVANHESFLDILCTCVIPGTERQFLAKPWVLRTPILGWVARNAGVVSSETWESAELLTRPQSDSGSIVIFPSGSRDCSAVDGSPPLRFRPGAFVLADKLTVPVLPVCIVGTGLAAPRGEWWIRSADLTCVVLPPMPRLADESIRDVAERCRQTIADIRMQQLADDLRHGRQRRWLQAWMIGQSRSLRQAMAAEWNQGQWHAILEAPPTYARPWLLLGLGWSSYARVIRLLQPVSALIGVESDPQQRGIAKATWFRDTTDHLESALADVDGLDQSKLGGLILFSPPTADDAARLSPALGRDTWIIVADRWVDAWARLLYCRAHPHGAGMHRLIPGHLPAQG